MRSNASTFRAMARIEETMMRAVMPRTDRLDPVVKAAVVRAADRPARVWSNGKPVAAIAPLTFPLAEVVNG